ncbi:MAG: hypothetical protein QM760_18275 [Nibricoccus sp.]
MKTITLLLAILLPHVGHCAEKIIINNIADEPATPEQVKFWKNTRPEELIHILRQTEEPYFSVDGRCYDYVEPDDVPKLIALLDSEDPCAHLVSALSSYRAPKKSTVGIQAGYLLRCFRDRMCPTPLLGYEDTNANSLKAWYRLWRLQNPKRFPEISPR